MCADEAYAGNESILKGRPMRSRNGFTLIELMLVVAIIALIAVIAIPNILRSRVSAESASAVNSMRQIVTAETAYQTSAFTPDVTGVGMYTTLPVLAALDPPLLDASIAIGSKNGYTFDSTLFGQSLGRPQFQASAIPGAEADGIRAYYVDQSGVIRFNSEGAEPTALGPPVN